MGSPRGPRVGARLEIWAMWGILKAETLYRRLGLSPSPVPRDRRGFIIIQVDGLSHVTFRHALRRGYLPYLRRLLRQGQLAASPLKVGLPTATPSFQAGIMYRGDAIPGFRWFDRRTGSLVTMRNFLDARRIEESLSRRAPGILEGGATYCTLFSGGAQSTTFTSAGISPFRLSVLLRARDVAIISLVNIGTLLRVLFLALRELAVEAYDQVRTIGVRRSASWSFAFLANRLISNVLFREVATLGATVDIRREIPSLYVSFLGYDELAHRRGPQSRYALVTLRGIDGAIRRIHRAAQRHRGRRYDLYVLSDHGQLPSFPFHLAFGQELREVLLAGSRAASAGTLASERDRGIGFLDSLVNQLQHLLPALPQRLRHVLRVPMRGLERIAREGRDRTRPGGPYEVLVFPTGDLAHVYFAAGARRFLIEELESLYPGLIPAIVRHPGIFAVAGLGEKGVHLLSRDGRVLLGEKGSPGGDGPLSGIEDGKYLAEEVERLVRMEDAGDLVVFGGFRGGRTFNFLGEFGSHGGLRGPEVTGFILYPRSVHFPFWAVRRPEELYGFFRNYVVGGA